MAQKGQPHASLVMSSSMTPAFSRLCPSNLWHYRSGCCCSAPNTFFLLLKETMIRCLMCKLSISQVITVWLVCFQNFDSFTVVVPTTILSPPSCRQYEGAADEGLAGAELLLQKQEEEVQRLQAHLASRLSRASVYPTDDPLAPSHMSMLDLRDPLFIHRKPKV